MEMKSPQGWKIGREHIGNVTPSQSWTGLRFQFTLRPKTMSLATTATVFSSSVSFYWSTRTVLNPAMTDTNRKMNAILILTSEGSCDDHQAFVLE